MKIFEKDGKINFVDDNNVFVGFDYRGECCEVFGYSIMTFQPLDMGSVNQTEWLLPLDDFNFDPLYFKEIGFEDEDNDDIQLGVTFRLIDSLGNEIFLTLYNHHNGYYCHGFEATINGQEWQRGEL